MNLNYPVESKRWHAEQKWKAMTNEERLNIVHKLPKNELINAGSKAFWNACINELMAQQ